MPVYEYRCTQCHKIFEYQQRMADAAKTVCEECSGALERLISRSSFALKGDGWYKDLYSSAKPTAGSAASSEAKPSATVTESKPASDPKPSGGGGDGGSSTPSGGGGSTPPASSGGGGGTTTSGAS